MAKLLKWQQKILDQIEGYSNAELIAATFDLAQGDSYDGEFTDRGHWEYLELLRELHKRLTPWLLEDIKNSKTLIADGSFITDIETRQEEKENCVVASVIDSEGKRSEVTVKRTPFK